MFGKLLSYATSGITNLIAKYAVRASVAVPFLFALGFGLAGLTVILIDAFGYRDAYLLLAGAFLALGVVAAVAVWVKERSDEASSAGIQTGSAASVAAMAVETAKQVPSAIAGGITDTSSSSRGLAKLTERNWPLTVAAAAAILLLGGLFSENRYGNHLRSRY